MSNHPAHPERTRALLKDAEALAKALAKNDTGIGCTHPMDPKEFCIVLAEDEDRRRKRSRGFNGYNTDNMCSACAAYWAACVAVNHLHSRLRRDLEVEAEESRKAVAP